MFSDPCEVRLKLHEKLKPSSDRDEEVIEDSPKLNVLSLIVVKEEFLTTIFLKGTCKMKLYR